MCFRRSTARRSWIYLVFMNSVWVWIPLVLLLDSFFKIVAACERSKIDLADEQYVATVAHCAHTPYIVAPKPAPTRPALAHRPIAKVWWLLTLLVLVAYLVLVPAVIMSV